MERDKKEKGIRKGKMPGKKKESCQRCSDYSDVEKENQVAKETEERSLHHNRKALKRNKRKLKKEGCSSPFTQESQDSEAIVLSGAGAALFSEPPESSRNQQLSRSLKFVTDLREALRAHVQ